MAEIIGIIGGSGMADFAGVTARDVRHVVTPYGAPSDAYRIGEFGGRDVVFLARHGLSHRIPPHAINYKANIWGFRELGVERIISVGATGGISEQMVPGTIVIPDQIIDFTSGRDSTFYHGDEGVIHIDFTEPYCPDLRQTLVRSGEEVGIRLSNRGTYVCVNGPRLETKAEIKAFASMGADLVGMTAMPEASLSRELGLCYASICVVTNFAAGVSKKPLTATEVVRGMRASLRQIHMIVQKTLSFLPESRGCSCRDSTREAKV